MKIRTRLLILMVSLVAVSLVLSGLLSDQIKASFIQDSNTTIRKVRTRQAISLIDSFLSFHEQRVKDLSMNLSSLIHLYKGDSRQTLQVFLNSNIIYRESSLVGQNGREMARVARHAVYGSEEMREFSQDPLFLKSLGGQSCTYQERIRNEFGEPLVNVYCPVYDEDKKVSHVLIHNIHAEHVDRSLSRW